jgi:serine/threonine-protein kinase RsbW
MNGQDAVTIQPGGPPAGQGRFFQRFSASPGDTRAVLAEVMANLAARGVSDESRGDVEIVLAEAINNIVEHAYSGKGGMVELCLCVTDGMLDCEILDWGVCMPGDAAPSPPLPRLDCGLDRFPEGGFGWSLIRSLTGGLSYRRSDGRNRLSFRIPLVRSPETLAGR